MGPTNRSRTRIAHEKSHGVATVAFVVSDRVVSDRVLRPTCVLRFVSDVFVGGRGFLFRRRGALHELDD